MDSKKDKPSSEKDTRIDCKYGVNCFQKNPDHHRKFKHPPKKVSAEKETNNKKRKNEEKEEKGTIEEPKSKKQSISPNSEKETIDSEISNNEKEIEKEKTSDEIAENKAVTDKALENETIAEKVSENEKVSEEVPEKEKVSETVSNTSNSESKDKDDLGDKKKLLEKLFEFTMPNDFYKFYDFCDELKPSDPMTAFKIADLKLVGAYDILNNSMSSETKYEPDEVYTHWRYYYDPPEFQTIVKGNDREGLHFGYWRDRPSSEPIFVASNSSNITHKIKPVAENIFGAVASYLEEKAKKANPFEKTGFFNLLGKLKSYAKKHNINLETQTEKMKSREKNVVARTIHGLGILCPYNKKTQLGYRELSVTDNQLLKIIKKIDDAKTEDERLKARSELDEVVRLATIAGDECDFGTCLELGHDLLSSGCVYVQKAALDVLSIAYNQLDRQVFLKIVEAHMKNRKKGSNLSCLKNTASKECNKLT